MSYQLQGDSKKERRQSFWGKLFGKRSKAAAGDRSIIVDPRNSSLYHSFHCTTPKREEEVFTTLDNSAEMREGVIFLKAPLWKEDNKHVQFVPTPQNKYYAVDVKAAPSRRRDDKENQPEQPRPILRKGPEEGEGPPDDSKMPRTSTRLALFDRKNGSMPHLNVSGITQYGSLPRSYRGDLHPELRSRHASELQGRSGHPSLQDLPGAAVRLRSGSSHQNAATHRQSIGDPMAHARSMMGTDVMGRSTRSEAVARKKQPGFNNNQKQPQVPNRAINEIGLPLATEKRSRSQSPHYIPLRETFSGGRTDIPKNHDVPPGREEQFRNLSKFRKHGVREEQFVQRNQVPHASDATDPDYSHFLQQARRQLVRSSMYGPPKRKGKKCKYKSKECEDGFSSMADDECSFNCSCSSCSLGLAAKEGSRLSSSKEDKYFFICTDIKEEENEQDACPPELPPRDETGDAKPKTRYEYNVDAQPREKMGVISTAKTCYECPAAPAHEKTGTVTTAKSCYECPDAPVPEKTGIVCSGKTCYGCPDAPATGKTGTVNTAKSCHECPDSQIPEMTRTVNTAKSGYECPDAPTLEKTVESGSNAKTWYECNDSFCSTPKVEQSTPQNNNNKGKGKIAESIYENITQIINSATKSNLKTRDVERVFSTPVSESNNPARSSNKVCRSLFASRENLAKHQDRSPVVFSDSVVLLQEIFQKLSLECRELLQPDVPDSGSRYVDDLVKNLRSSGSVISEGDFANIIGGIAQNVFLEAKKKNLINQHSTSLPDLTSGPDSGFRSDDTGNEVRSDITTVEGRDLPDGWNRSPDRDDSKSSESSEQMMENVIRLGMGLPPVRKEATVTRATFFACSPAKASKFKSRDVLSCKGKLKIKIYKNGGLVTVHVMRAAKLHRMNGRELNPYIKISMVPDTSKRVHCRTTVIRGQKCPVFNQKFSFEVLEEDITKRLVFSVWHREFAKERSELVGCMSFSVKHVLDESHKIDGWYRLLREGFGTQKHFAAHKKNSCYLKRSK